MSYNKLISNKIYYGIYMFHKMSTNHIEVYHNLLDALSRPIKDNKKLECYEYFLEHIKPNISKSEYSEQTDRNRGVVDLVISPSALTFEQLSTLLGIILG